MHLNVQTVKYDTPAAPCSVAIGDLNRDGYLDLVTVNCKADSVSVFLRKAAGEFSLDKSYSIGKGPKSVALADLNGDSNLDIVIANYDENSISVLLGNADGKFSLDKNYSVGKGPRSLAIADLNGDGYLDIVVANYDDKSVSVLQNVGWSFAQAMNSPYSVGAEPTSVAIGDLNRDGHQDIVTVNYFGASVSVLLGNSNKTFSVLLGKFDKAFSVLPESAKTFFPVQNYLVDKGPFSVAIADLDGDGYLDIVTDSGSDYSVATLYGNSNATFSPSPKSPHYAGAIPCSVAIADLNKDGYFDLVTANCYEDSISVLLGNARGEFSQAPNSSYPVGKGPSSVAIADLNRDGNLDIVTANYDDNSLSITFGIFDGPFSQSLEKFSDQELSSCEPITYGGSWWSNPLTFAISIAVIALGSCYPLKQQLDSLKRQLDALSINTGQSIQQIDTRLDNVEVKSTPGRELPPYTAPVTQDFYEAKLAGADGGEAQAVVHE
jgi:hypothetical protein